MPVLVHDEVVWRGPRRLRVADVPRDRLPARVPSLADLRDVCGTDYELSLDLKDVRALRAVLSVWPDHGRLWLCGLLPDVLDWRTSAGTARLVDSTPLERDEPVDGRLAALRRHGVDVLNLRQRAWTPRRVDATHGAGLLAFGWDAHSARRLRRLVDLGVDGVYSDSVRALVDLPTGTARD